MSTVQYQVSLSKRRCKLTTKSRWHILTLTTGLPLFTSLSWIRLRQLFSLPFTKRRHRFLHIIVSMTPKLSILPTLSAMQSQKSYLARTSSKPQSLPGENDFMFDQKIHECSDIKATKSNPKKKPKHTTAGIRWWSPTQLLISRSEAYVWQSGRDAQFSSVYGRTWQEMHYFYNIDYFLTLLHMPDHCILFDRRYIWETINSSQSIPLITGLNLQSCLDIFYSTDRGVLGAGLPTSLHKAYRHLPTTVNYLESPGQALTSIYKPKKQALCKIYTQCSRRFMRVTFNYQRCSPRVPHSTVMRFGTSSSLLSSSLSPTLKDS